MKFKEYYEYWIKELRKKSERTMTVCGNIIDTLNKYHLEEIEAKNNKIEELEKELKEEKMGFID